MNETTVRFVDAITRSFHGWLPADADVIVNALEQYLPCLRDEPDEQARQMVRDELALEIRRAWLSKIRWSSSTRSTF